jgi:hypothetical protein
MVSFTVTCFEAGQWERSKPRTSRRLRSEYAANLWWPQGNPGSFALKYRRHPRPA